MSSGDANWWCAVYPSRLLLSLVHTATKMQAQTQDMECFFHFLAFAFHTCEPGKRKRKRKVKKKTHTHTQVHSRPPSISWKEDLNCACVSYFPCVCSGRVNFVCVLRRQCGPVIRALALRSGDPGFKTRSDHLLNLFLIVPGSTSQLPLWIANWFASCQLGFSTVVVVVVLFCCFVVFHWPWKAPMGSGQLSMYCFCVVRVNQALVSCFAVTQRAIFRGLEKSQSSHKLKSPRLHWTWDKTVSLRNPAPTFFTRFRMFFW